MKITKEQLKQIIKEELGEPTSDELVQYGNWKELKREVVEMLQELNDFVATNEPNDIGKLKDVALALGNILYSRDMGISRGDERSTQMSPEDEDFYMEDPRREN